MASLKKNDLWKDIEKNSEAAQDKILGPSYEYTNSTVPPGAKGVSSDGNLGQIFTNAGAVQSYVNDLIFGGNTPYGNAQFVETGGNCKAPGGSIIPRWSYINNKLSGNDAMPQNVKSAMGGFNFNGIIPGMFGDISSLNPTKTLNALKMEGEPDCQLFKCAQTDSIGNFKGDGYHFLVPEFEQNLKYCQQITDPKQVKDYENTANENAKKTKEDSQKDNKKNLSKKLKSMGVTSQPNGDKSVQVKNISPVLDVPTDAQKDSCAKCAESKKEKFEQDNFYPFTPKKNDPVQFIVPLSASFQIASTTLLGFALVLASMIFMFKRYFKTK